MRPTRAPNQTVADGAAPGASPLVTTKSTLQVFIGGIGAGITGPNPMRPAWQINAFVRTFRSSRPCPGPRLADASIPTSVCRHPAGRRGAWPSADAGCCSCDHWWVSGLILDGQMAGRLRAPWLPSTGQQSGRARDGRYPPRWALTIEDPGAQLQRGGFVRGHHQSSEIKPAPLCRTRRWSQNRVVETAIAVGRSEASFKSENFGRGERQISATSWRASSGAGAMRSHRGAVVVGRPRPGLGEHSATQLGPSRDPTPFQARGSDISRRPDPKHQDRKPISPDLRGFP